jgi:hypothetical protein
VCTAVELQLLLSSLLLSNGSNTSNRGKLAAVTSLLLALTSLLLVLPAA